MLKPIAVLKEQLAAEQKNLSQENQPQRIGYFCTYVPEEIIIALGMRPVRVFGGSAAPSEADEHLPTWLCSFARSCLAAGLQGEYDGLAGVITAHTCDTMRHMAENWVEPKSSTGFYRDVVAMPCVKTTPEASEYQVREITRFAQDLAVWSNKTTSPEQLEEALKQVNTTRKLLTGIASQRQDKPGALSAADFAFLIRAATCLDKSLVNPCLEQIEAALAGQPKATPDRGAPRVLVSGSILENEEVLREIEQLGFDIVADDLCQGSRYYLTLVEEDSGDPLSAIALRYLERTSCPCKNATAERKSYLVERVMAVGAQGVIFLLEKFCDPHLSEYPGLERVLGAKGVPSLLVDIEGREGLSEQARVRLQAFSEMVCS